MHSPNFILRWAALGAVVFGTVLAQTSSQAQGWWLEGGPVVRGGMSVKVSGSSYAQVEGIHDPRAAGPLGPPGGIGSATAYGDRTYDNGYVKLDPGTGNATTLDPNTTWNWGFNDPGQYNAGAQSLTFQKQGLPGYTTGTDRGFGGSESMLGAGLQLRGGVGLWQSGKWTLDLALGFQGIWGADTTLNATPYRESVSQVTVSDRYDTSGIGVGNFPATGFRGTYLGPFDHPPVIPSPVLPNLPQSRSSANSGVLSSSQDNVTLEVQQNLYEFSVGPQLGYAASSALKLSLRPTIGLDLVNLDVPRSEVFVQTPAGGPSVVVSRWSNQASQTAALLGFGVTGGADLDLGKGFYAGLFGGYEWVAQKVNLTVGPNAVSFDGSGYVVGAVFGKRF
jgi:hypothetical protein